MPCLKKIIKLTAMLCGIIILCLFLTYGHVFYKVATSPTISISDTNTQDSNLAVIEQFNNHGDICSSIGESIRMLSKYHFYQNKNNRNIDRQMNELYMQINNFSKYAGVNKLKIISNLSFGVITNIPGYLNYNGNSSLCIKNYLPLKQKYLNQTYFGNGIYGYEKASDYYFGINTSKLNLCQSIILSTVIPKAPTRFTATGVINQSGRQYAQDIIKNMYSENMIDQTTYQLENKNCSK